MNWVESIEEIRKAQENNQLVVFVGAGVSRNSGLPSWGQLVNAIADTIGYKHSDRCTTCDKQNTACQKNSCGAQQDFSQDEYLRIPEYFYQQDNSDNHKDYYDFIVRTLNSDNGPNPIDDEIFNLLPHHIITTNYDALLEKTKNSNVPLYTVVSEDSDLLSKANNRYIIKMHGDLAFPSSMVLKESDYIDYEQDHPLISTFVRSLLINHSFLFLGYSLNDYNLNLIIGWINYFQKKYGVAERPKSFLVSGSTSSAHEEKRQESHNIYVVDTSTIPEEIIEKVMVPASLTDSAGKKLYAYLRAISDSTILDGIIPLSKTLGEKYKVFSSYNKVAHYDLLKVQNIGKAFFASTEIVFVEEESFTKVVEAIQSDNKIILNTFQKAGLSAIECHGADSHFRIPYDETETDTFYELYLKNEYLAIQDKINDDPNYSRRVYYSHLFGDPISKTSVLIEKMYENNPPSDYVSVLLCKMRERLAKLTLFDRQKALTNEIAQLFYTTPVRYRNAVGFLKILFDSPAQQLREMQEILDKQEKRNEYGRRGWESGHAFTHIWSLQAIVYDYYFFFKENYLPYDYYTDTYRYFSYYIQAILCSYLPVAPRDNIDDVFAITTDHRKYPLNDIDLDILVKYTKTIDLKSWLKKFAVQSILIEKCSDIILKYQNLCKCFVACPHQNWPEQIFNFTIIICSAEMDMAQKTVAFSSFVDAFEAVSNHSAHLCGSMFEALFYVFSGYPDVISESDKNRILSVLLKENIFATIRQRYKNNLARILKTIGPKADTSIKAEQQEYIESLQDKTVRSKELYYRRFILPSNMLNKLIPEAVPHLDTEKLFNLLVEKQIQLSSEIQERFIGTLRNEEKKRTQNPYMRSFTDWMTVTIEECIVLHLLGLGFDITLLQPYSMYSPYLQFMLNPNEFNYSAVNTENYMWQNLIYSKQYGKYFIEHKESILSLELKRIFKLDLASSEQRKIVYGVLLEEDELRDFP